MKQRFFDIVVENSDNQEISLNQEFVLDIPEHDTSSPMERMEYNGVLLDTLISASGLNVCSFRNEPVILE